MTAKRNGFSRRDLLKGFAGGTGLMMLGGLPRTLVRAQEGPVTISYWHGWTEQWENYVQDVVDQFHAAQDEVRVEPTVVASSDLITRMTAAIAAGTPPDIVTLFSPYQIPGLAALGALIPYEELGSPEEIAALKDFFTPAALAGGMVDGELYGTASGFGILALAWNKHHAAEAGLDAEAGPATLEELEMWIDALTIQGENGDLERLGLLALTGAGDYLAWFANFGGQLYDPLTDAITANHPNNVRAVEWLASLTEKYGVDRTLRFVSGLADERQGVADPFISERLSMQLIGPWKLGDFERYSAEGFSWGLRHLPGLEGDPQTGQGTYIWGNYQIIPVGASNPQAAYEFAKFWTGISDPAVMTTAVAWQGTPTTVSGSPTALEVPGIVALFDEYPDYRIFFEGMSSPNAITPPMIAVGNYYIDRLQSEVDAALRLETTAQAALDAVQVAVENEYNNWKSQNS